MFVGQAVERQAFLISQALPGEVVILGRVGDDTVEVKNNRLQASGVFQVGFLPETDKGMWKSLDWRTISAGLSRIPSE